jgi:hypothetical protein
MGDFFLTLRLLHSFETPNLQKNIKDNEEQGDQIGRIFGYWATVYLGRFFSSAKSKKLTKSLGYFFPR